MNYAMVLKNRVIDVLIEQEKEPCYPPDSEGNSVSAIACVDTIVIGMLYNLETGDFSEDVGLHPKPEPTETERIMQGFTDSELRDLEIQQNQELLAQQITDIEVALLGGGR